MEDFKFYLKLLGVACLADIGMILFCMIPSEMIKDGFKCFVHIVGFAQTIGMFFILAYVLDDVRGSFRSWMPSILMTIVISGLGLFTMHVCSDIYPGLF